MTHKQLEYFVRIYECSNLAKAAEQMYLTPQAVSKSIRVLEKELDATLFARTPNGVLPTAEGKYLYAKAKPMVDAFCEFEGEIRRQFHQFTGSFSLGITTGALRSLSPQLLIRARGEMQDLDLRESNVPDALCENGVRTGKFDLACMARPSSLDGLEFKQIKEERFYAIYPEGAFPGRDLWSVADLKGKPLISSDEQTYSYRIVADACLREGFRPDFYYLSKEVSLLRKILSHHNAVLVAPEHITWEVDGTGLEIAPIEGRDFKWELGFVLQKGAKPKSCVKLFMSFVFKHAR